MPLQYFEFLFLSPSMSVVSTMQLLILCSVPVSCLTVIRREIICKILFSFSYVFLGKIKWTCRMTGKKA
jgi:hypothetical protein